MFLSRVYHHVKNVFKLPFNLKKAGFYSLLVLIFLACIFKGAILAQEVGKLSGYVTIDQNEVTYRTYEACLATQATHGTAYTRCVVDSKLGGTPGFGYNCGARAFTEIFGYWANNGYPDLMNPLYPSLPNGAVPDNSAQTLALFNLAGVEYTTYGDYGSYYCHNCDTSMTAYADHYRKVRTVLTTKVASYFTARGYSATVVAKGLAGYDEIKAEIVAGRPVALLMENCNHWITAIGYNDAGPNLIALVGHERFSSNSGCWYLNTGLGEYEAEFSYSYFAISGNNAVFVIPAPLTPVPPPEPPPPSPPDPTYSVGGSITGLTNSGLTIRMTAGGEPKSIPVYSTTYKWTGVAMGTYYDVHVVTNPIGLNCIVSNHEGFAGRDITNVNISCKKIARKR